MNANIYEIFNSIQGEGIYVGARQIFVRFCGCQLNCGYCDTQEAQSPVDRCRIHDRHINNPLNVNTVIDAINGLWTPSTRHISLTGGEPLLHAGFIKELAGYTSRPMYLETNAGIPDAARTVSDAIEIAACDIKLPEHRSTDEYDRLHGYELETIRIFHSRDVETFAKIIVLRNTTIESIKKAILDIEAINSEIPLILQPATPLDIDMGQLLGLMDFAGMHLSDIRIIPQMHRLIGVP